MALKVICGGQFVDESYLRMFRRETETLALGCAQGGVQGLGLTTMLNNYGTARMMSGDLAGESGGV